jgi:hypothetical protein
LLRGVALGAVISLSAGAVAHANAPHKKSHRATPAASQAQVAALIDEVQALKANLAAETAARQQLQSQVDQATAQVAASRAQVQTAEARAAEAQAAVIKTIPADVAIEVAKVKPKTDGLYFRGVKITPGGFLEAAEVYREHNTANDISTGLNTIPYPVTRQGHTQELLFTPRQSRVSALVEGKPTDDITLSMYGEFDFQGAAQSANSNETNSYNPRIRHLYGTIDWGSLGLHFLAGQTFSLVTLDSKGITPRNEVTPLTIDGQYHVGFTWARQPMVRLTKDLFDKHLWISVSAENPQTTFTGSVPAGVIDNINNGQGYYAGETNTGVAATQSLNHLPDFVGKIAIEEDLGGHHVHAEVLGLERSFYEQLATLQNKTLNTGALGAGLTVQVIPGWFDFQASGLTGKGIGRYGSGQLPDVTFNTNGVIEPIEETIVLVGGTVHATKSLDLWAFAGEEHDNRASYGSIGYGNPVFVNTGCNIEASALTCTGNTKLLGEASAGFWQKFYQGPWGQIRFGLQYSYIERDAFAGVGGAPIAHENMLYTSFRYYPFQ